MIYVGVDVGSSTTKAVLLDQERHLLGWAVRRSGVDLSATAELCLDEALAQAGLERRSLEMVAVSTGYGRRNVLYRQGDKTEISCHGKGCFHFFPQAMTVIDIGGQDNKIIQLNSEGRRLNFKMNRKCAAGTGAFLEEVSRRLEVPLADLDGLARLSTELVELGSYCTVFTATEVLEKIREGKKAPDIVKGLFLSVVKRVLEMGFISDTVAMTGGVVAFNPYLVQMVGEAMERPVLVPPYPQLTGAWGAALYAQELALVDGD